MKKNNKDSLLQEREELKKVPFLPTDTTVKRRIPKLSFNILYFTCYLFAIKLISRQFLSLLRNPEMVYHDHNYGEVQVSYASFDLISFLQYQYFSFSMVIKATPLSNTHQSFRVIVDVQSFKVHKSGLNCVFGELTLRLKLVKGALN